MENIRSYVPEDTLTQGKHASVWRCFHGDCLVFSTQKPYPILADRTAGICHATLLTDRFAFSPQTLTQLADFLRRPATPYRPFACAGGTLLIFSQLCQSTSLALALYFHEHPENLEKSIEIAERGAFSACFDPNEAHKNERNPSLSEQLAEILFYTHRIFSEASQTHLHRHCKLIANFVGCRTQQVNLPAESCFLSGRDKDRLTAFLLCTFLSLRKRDGIVRAEMRASAAKTDEPNLKLTNEVERFSIRLEQVADVQDFGDLPLTPQETETRAPLFSFLAEPCFQNFSASLWNGKLILETVLYPSSNLYAPSVHGRRIKIRLLIEAL